MEAKYQKRRNSWIVDKTIDGKRKTVEYSVLLYGDYAKELAEKSYKDNVRYKNYIVIEDDHAVIKAYSEKIGYQDILIDIEDIERVLCCKWGLDVDDRDGLYRIVARNYHKGLLHRFILGLTPDNASIIDHIDRNPLNNQKSNLRIVNDRLNQQNKNPQKNNKSGEVGVRFNSKLEVWTARITDNNGKRTSKSFSINKYGNDEAKSMAIAWRKAMAAEYGYLT